METQSKSTIAERRVIVLIHSAIAGASIAAALELASRETHPPLLLFSLGSFAIAIPAALALVILSQVVYEPGKQYFTNGSAENPAWPAEKGLCEKARESTVARNAGAINE